MKKQIMKAISLSIVIMLTAVLIIPVALAQNNEIDEARHAVVRVVVPGYATGSAFIVAQSGTSTVLVTNNHVVEPARLGDLKVYIFPSDVGGSWIEAQVTFLPIGLDLAILTTVTGLSGRPALPIADIDSVRAAEPVFALGFPGTADAVVDYGEWLPSSPDDVTITSGVVSTVSVSLDGTDAIQHDSYISGGNSGGPLLNADGAVIGINTWINPTAAAARSVNYAIHTSYLIAALNEFGVEYTKYSGTSDPSTEEPGGEPPGNTPDEPGTEEPIAQTPGGNQNNQSGSGSGDFFSNYWWTFAIGGGVALIVAAIMVIMKSKSSKGSASSASQKTVAAASDGKTQVPGASGAGTQLLCTKGHFSGSTFPINGLIAIGRDPKKCQVIFPDDSKGISSLHCEITEKQGSYTLTDKGSSFGTFLSGGRKLTANQGVTLNKGDTFYLADPKIEFKLL